MESLSNPTIFLPIVLVGAILLIALFVISRKKIGTGKFDTRDCPHCKKTMEAAVTECNFGLRKVVFV